MSGTHFEHIDARKPFFGSRQFFPTRTSECLADVVAADGSQLLTGHWPIEVYSWIELEPHPGPPCFALNVSVHPQASDGDAAHAGQAIKGVTADSLRNLAEIGNQPVDGTRRYPRWSLGGRGRVPRGLCQVACTHILRLAQEGSDSNSFTARLPN